MKLRAIFINAVCFLFITMFVYAAVSKWLIFNVFVAQINKQPFDDKYTPLLVWAIPVSEVTVSLLMVFDRTRLLGLRIGTAMMILFTGYIILIMMHFFGKVPCACGGAITEFSWTQHLFFNLFFVCTGVWALLLMRKDK
jgi:uncharacterized membrane-anchored protein